MLSAGLIGLKGEKLSRVLDGSFDALESYMTLPARPAVAQAALTARADASCLPDVTQQLQDASSSPHPMNLNIDSSCKDSAAAASTSGREVDRQPASDLSYEAFVLNYMLPNRPVIIEVTSAMHQTHLGTGIDSYVLIPDAEQGQEHQ